MTIYVPGPMAVILLVVLLDWPDLSETQNRMLHHAVSKELHLILILPLIQSLLWLGLYWWFGWSSYRFWIAVKSLDILTIMYFHAYLSLLDENVVNPGRRSMNILLDVFKTFLLGYTLGGFVLALLFHYWTPILWTGFEEVMKLKGWSFAVGMFASHFEDMVTFRWGMYLLSYMLLDYVSYLLV